MATIERQRPAISVRVRITIVVAVLAAAALGLTGLISYSVQRDRLQERTAEQIAQEFSGLRQFAQATSSNDAARLVDLYLRRHVPNPQQVAVSWYDGAPGTTSVGNRAIAESPQLQATVPPLLADGGTRAVDIPPLGPALISVQPVQIGQTKAALVIVTLLRTDRAELARSTRTYAIVATLCLLLVTGLAGAAAGRLLAPLRVLRETADEISETDLARRIPISGHDDITAVTRTLNRMLERLEQAFASQRRFLDDAGHELRTPLTILRGHLEVLDAGNADDVAETRALLLDEVDRMARLVEELIELAKSERPDFVVPTEVEIAPLTDDMFAKARGLGDRDWVLAQRAEGVSATIDPQRLTQAVLQLAENAVKHTSPGDRITVGSQLRGPDLVFWVHDRGPGIRPQDREVVFERFVQGGDGSADGFGLGLSLVRAIARAHGGDAVIAENLDQSEPGVRVELILPCPAQEVLWPTS